MLSILHHGLHLLLLPVYIRHIPPAEYGVLAAVTIMATLIAAVSNLKLDAAMRTFYFDYSEDATLLAHYLRQLFSVSLYGAIMVFAIMLLFGSQIYDWVFVHEEVSFYPHGAVALAAACANMSLAVYFVYLRNSLQLWVLVRWEALLLSGTIALQLFLVVVLGFGIAGILWGSLLPALLTLALLCAVRRDLLGARPDFACLGPSLKYATPLMGMAVLYALGTRLDRIVLERHAELETVGAYALLIGLVGLLNIVISALDNTLRPYLYPRMRAFDGSTARVVDSYQRLYVATGLIALSSVVLLGSCLHFVTDNPAYLSVQSWLVLGATAFVPLVFSRFYALIYDYYKRSGSLTVSVVARVAVLYVMLVTLVPDRSVVGALWAVLVAESLNAALLWLVANRLFGIRAPLGAVVFQVLIFLSGLWLTAYVMANASPVAFGLLQWTIITVSLLAANGRLLRRGLMRHVAPVAAQSMEVRPRP